jgi:hypothetical protein
MVEFDRALARRGQIQVTVGMKRLAAGRTMNVSTQAGQRDPPHSLPAIPGLDVSDVQREDAVAGGRCSARGIVRPLDAIGTGFPKLPTAIRKLAL